MKKYIERLLISLFYPLNDTDIFFDELHTQYYGNAPKLFFKIDN